MIFFPNNVRGVLLAGCFGESKRTGLPLVALMLFCTPAQAEMPPFEPLVSGVFLGLEAGVLAANVCAPGEGVSSWTRYLAVGGVLGLAGGFWVNSLVDEPFGPATIRASALGLAIPAAVLFWTELMETRSFAASEDASWLIKRQPVGFIAPEKKR